ncbi:MAG: protein kinase [Myxococcales bacterium]
MASGPTRYGKYLLLEKLNGGGMSEIWRAASSGATHANLAIKRMLPNMATDTEIVAMFINEARIAAQLAHPNIAQIFDLGRIGDDFFIAMEYVGGADLRTVLTRSAELGSPMPIPLVVFVAAQVCDALDYAHRKTGVSGEPLGLVHRDISPENCLVTFDGTVKLIDFGIAKVTRQASKTKAGVLKGKLGYMSPEQVTGQAVDRRSDLFSLATVLYELVTGRQLFKAENEYMTVHALCRGRIAAPSEANPAVPAELDRIVLKALSRDRVQRYQWASELAADLRSFLGTLRPEPGPALLRKFMSVAFAPELAVERARRTAWARAHAAREAQGRRPAGGRGGPGRHRHLRAGDAGADALEPADDRAAGARRPPAGHGAGRPDGPGRGAAAALAFAAARRGGDHLRLLALQRRAGGRGAPAPPVAAVGPGARRADRRVRALQRQVMANRAATARGLLALALWASTVALSRSLSEAVGATTGACAALAAGGALSLGLGWAKGQAPWAAVRLPRRYLLGCGALFVGYMACLYAAIGLAADRPTALVVGLLNYLWPPLMVAFSVPLLGQRARPGVLALGCALALGGTAVAVAGDDGASAWAAGLGLRSAAPLALAAVAGVLWALYSNLARRWGPASGAPAADAVPLFLLASAVALALLRLALPEEPRAWTARSLAELFALAVGPMAVAYPLWEKGVRSGDHALLGLASFFVPVLSLGLASAWLGVVPGRGLAAGCALVVAGALVSRASLLVRAAPAGADQAPTG